MRFFLVALVGAFLLTTAIAYACSCRPFANAAEHAAAVDMIFRGRVVETVPDPRAPEYFSITTFELTSPIFMPPNGEPPPERVVVHHASIQSGPQCSIWYEPGQEALILAELNQAGELVTSSCLAPRWSEAEYRAVFRLAP